MSCGISQIVAEFANVVQAELNPPVLEGIQAGSCFAVCQSTCQIRMKCTRAESAQLGAIG